MKFKSKKKNLLFGFNGMAIIWDHRIQKGKKYYQTFMFSGSQHYLASLYYDFYRGRYNVFGEAAYSETGGIALIQGAMFNWSSSVESSLLIRYYSPAYFSPLGNAFSEFSGISGETGIYWGIRLRPLPRITINAYFDLFKPLWLKYNMFSFNAGYEYMFKLAWQVRRYVLIGIRFRVQQKERNQAGSINPEYYATPGIKKSLQAQFRWGKERGFYTLSAMNGSIFKLEDVLTSGWALSQDAGYRQENYDASLRFAVFNCMDYENRQYFYEKDLFMYFSVPAYSGKGYRFYIMYKRSFSFFLDAWIKAGIFQYPGLEGIGSGLNYIPGNKKTEIRCQVRIKF